MKKISKKTRILEVAVAFTIALVFIMPCATVLAISERPMDIEKGSKSTWQWVMNVPQVVAHPGEPNVVIPITGSWNDELAGYCIGLEYDSSKIEIVGISLEGTVASAYPEGWWISGYWSWDDEIITASTFTVGADFIPPGTGALFKIIVNINEDVDIYTMTEINFYEDPEAQPPIKSRYYLPDSTGVHPQYLTGGHIFFIPPVYRSIDEDADI